MIWNTLRFLFPWFLILGMGVAWGLSFHWQKWLSIMGLLL